MLLEPTAQRLLAGLPNIDDGPVLEEHIHSDLLPRVDDWLSFALLGSEQSALVAGSGRAPLDLVRVPPLAVGSDQLCHASTFRLAWVLYLLASARLCGSILRKLARLPLQRLRL